MDAQIIFSRIYELRGLRVMLDYDLAELYGIETATLKRAVRRNTDRFPDDFMFVITADEFNFIQRISLRCQNGISNRGGIRYMPFAFTEQGVAMLSSVLNSKQAIAVNIGIMRAFVETRRHLSSYEELRQRIERIEETQIATDAQLADLYEILTQLASKDLPSNPRPPIGYIK